MIAFKDRGHDVFSLSQQEGKEIHDFLSGKGIKTESYVVPGKRSGLRYYLRHLLYFVRFCRRHKIEIVYSHLEPANFVASIGQYFVRGRVFLCRHHIDEGRLYNFDRDFYYMLTYRLAKSIIVVSDHARRYMVRHEGIPERKIIHINLAYDFSLYPLPNAETVMSIRGSGGCLLLLSACRFTKFKRPDQILLLLKNLIDRGVNARLIMLGKGEMENELRNQIRNLGLDARVELPGYVNNIIDHMAAADFFLHPSLLESSCVVVKEAGLARLPVIVCKGVGDFDEYLLNGVSGFLTDRDKFVDQGTEIIRSHMNDEGLRRSMGSQLEILVRQRFSIENVLPQYEKLNLVTE
jgi:glycosyltransferase involved in cell wall biosynthesis